MKKLTKTQKATLILIVVYFIWELSIWLWTQSASVQGTVIRVDLILIYPILLVLIIISIIQLIKKKR